MANTDKLPLSEYIGSIMEQVAAAQEKFEKKHPQWRIPSVDIVARGVLKPVAGVVFVDIDEPTKAAWSDIPIKMARLPGVDPVEITDGRTT